MNESYCDSESNSTVEEFHYANDRGDRYSEESSGYHVSTKVDPNSTNKKFVRRTNPDTGKKTRVEFFQTNPNTIIKNAITGTFQGTNGRFFRSGSKYEDLFFSVILATGELGQTAPTLFYDNPEQYERHFFTELPQEIKDRWTEKKDTALYYLKLQQKQDAIDANGGVILVK
jgi:hypothetical protein